MEGEARTPCRATAGLHRDDCTMSWQSTPARGIAAVGPAIEGGLDIQVVPEG